MRPEPVRSIPSGSVFLPKPISGGQIRRRAQHAGSSDRNRRGDRRVPLSGRAAPAARRVLAETGESAEAASWFQRAIDTARGQEAKSLELRAATSLARLWRDQGKRARPATCSRLSTAGSPKASIPPTSGTPRLCSMSWHEQKSFGCLVLVETAKSTTRWRATYCNEAPICFEAVSGPPKRNCKLRVCHRSAEQLFCRIESEWVPNGPK